MCYTVRHHRKGKAFSSPLANIKLPRPSYQAIKLTRKEKIRNLKKESQAAQDRLKNFGKGKTFISHVQEIAEFKGEGT